MTVDVPNQNVPAYAQPPPAYVPQQVDAQANYSYPTYEYNNQGNTTIIRTKKAGGSGLAILGFTLWVISFFFLYDSGIFWTLQVISYGVCCFGTLIAYTGSRRNRTYIVQNAQQYEPSPPSSSPYVASYPAPGAASYPAPPANPAYV
eukprot:CAMPEP_0117037412 /NCGR_PEP_ID=MMETSP0472-20121206/26411_1 /TAXON_ID=693140 ORGANISM="Tiarina fusus, Strain LIS" /NCGR_SAMPLE_ID=MMETSP0472 /ASSEMBLY_ACC=CAM_ASM_000603 /LENGTH=146 /DNA_ID=CAMNT_0004747393 /DNA_START=1 /DNA_END=441 /DNA_ORIENTATION=+